MTYYEDFKSISSKATTVALNGTKKAIAFSKKPECEGITSMITGAVAGAAIVGVVTIAGSSGLILGAGLIGGMVLQKLQSRVTTPAAPAPPAVIEPPVMVVPNDNSQNARRRRNANRNRT